MEPSLSRVSHSGPARWSVRERAWLRGWWSLAPARLGPSRSTRRYPAGTPLVAHYVRVQGTRIRYTDTGSGTPVLFIHGLGESMYAWRQNWEPVTAAGFRVIAFDNRGFGFSEKPDTGYSNASYTHVVLGLMDALGLPDAGSRRAFHGGGDRGRGRAHRAASGAWAGVDRRRGGGHAGAAAVAAGERAAG